MDRPPSLEEQIEFYDQWNQQCRAGGFDEIESEIRDRAVVVLKAMAESGVRAAGIIEIGCGTGWLTGELSKFGRVTAIDLSPRAIEIARSRHKNVEFVAGDFFVTDFPGEAFDVMVCIETLFYVPDQPRFVEKMASLLKPGGLLFVTTINKFVYERSSDIGPPKPGQVRQWLSRGEVAKLLSRHFRVESVRSIAPRGDKGVLRLVNSYKVNAILGRVTPPGALRRIKERAGLGGGLVYMARR